MNREEVQVEGELIRRLLNQRASYSDLSRAVNRLKLGHSPPYDCWLLAVSAATCIAASDLAWLERSEARWLRYSARSFVARALTKSRPESWPGNNLWDSYTSTLDTFASALASENDSTVLGFAWEVLSWETRDYTGDYKRPVRLLKWSGRLSGEISYENIELAIILATEADSMYWWPDERWKLVDWERDSRVYLACLEYPSYLVRAAGAHALGELFFGCCRKIDSSGAPSIPDMMTLIQSHEQRTAGIAGPFLQGAHWSIEPEPWNSVDLRTWFLETLRTSSRERDVPHLQSLEFYAHELFCEDPDAIRAMLAMGRDYLAVLTATESPEKIYDLLPLLQEMAASDNPWVSRAMKVYLGSGRPHAGIEIFDEDASVVKWAP